MHNLHKKIVPFQPPRWLPWLVAKCAASKEKGALLGSAEQVQALVSQSLNIILRQRFPAGSGPLQLLMCVCKRPRIGPCFHGGLVFSLNPLEAAKP